MIGRELVSKIKIFISNVKKECLYNDKSSIRAFQIFLSSNLFQ
jgi:hypothetical protein